jgi:hypothetical protein
VKKNVSFIEFQNRIKVNYLTKALKLVFIGFSSKNTDLTKITYLLKKLLRSIFDVRKGNLKTFLGRVVWLVLKQADCFKFSVDWIGPSLRGRQPCSLSFWAF